MSFKCVTGVAVMEIVMMFMSDLLVPLAGVQDHPQVAVQHGGATVDGESALEVVGRQLVLLLPVVYIPHAVPGVIVSWVDADSSPVAGDSLVKIFVRNVLVRGERVGIGKARIQLNCPKERHRKRLRTEREV
jgi:hypothetical protein